MAGLSLLTGTPSRQRLLGLLLVVAALLAAGLAIKATRGFEHDMPRQLPWAVPDYTKARYGHEILPDGRIQMQITHLPLIGITPEMLAWFYKVLPISTVEIAGTTYPLYHIFHLSEHGRVWVAEPAVDGSPGMGVGALVARQEWFGRFDSQGAGRITEFSSKGMTVRPEVAGIHLGEIRHQYEATPTGARYRVDSLIGVDWPLFGPAVNWLLRTTTFTEPMLVEWERHQIEEVGMLQHFLPRLFWQHAENYRFRLTLP